MVSDEQRERPLSTADVAGVASRQDVDRDGDVDVADRLEERVVVRTAKIRPVALLDEGEEDDFRNRWLNIQTGFVDEPRSAVEQADALVAEVIKRLAEKFAQERSKLEEQWSRGDDVSTEDLRIALQHYRSFFDRLLSL